MMCGKCGNEVHPGEVHVWSQVKGLCRIYGKPRGLPGCSNGDACTARLVAGKQADAGGFCEPPPGEAQPNEADRYGYGGKQENAGGRQA